MQLDWRLSGEPITEDTDPEHLDPAFREATRTKIYLGYTSERAAAAAAAALTHWVCLGVHGGHGSRRPRSSQAARGGRSALRLSPRRPAKRRHRRALPCHPA